MTWGSSLLVRGKATFGPSVGQSLLRFGMKYKKTCGIGGFAPLRDTRNLVICACRRRLVICACWRLLQIQTHLKLETFITRRGVGFGMIDIIVEIELTRVLRTMAASRLSCSSNSTNTRVQIQRPLLEPFQLTLEICFCSFCSGPCATALQNAKKC